MVNRAKAMLISLVKDFCFTPEFLARWHNFFPKAQIKCYEDAGHYVLEDAEENIFTDIRRFLLKNPIQNHR